MMATSPYGRQMLDWERMNELLAQACVSTARCEVCGLEMQGHTTPAGQEFHRLTVEVERHRAEDRDRRHEAFNEARERLMARLGAERLTDDETVIVALDRILSLLEPSDA